MKIRKIEVNEFVLSEQEAKLVKMCLDYAYHRLTKHRAPGIIGYVNEYDLDKLRKELI